MSTYQEDYNLDGSLTVDHLFRLVRFVADNTVGLCTAPGAEIGVLVNFYGDGRGCVLQAGGPVSVVAGEDLVAGDRITSDGQGKAVAGGSFALIISGAAADDAAQATLNTLPAPPQVSIDGPKTTDGKLMIVPNMFPAGCALYMTGAGDSGSRGGGDPWTFSSEAAETQTLEFGFNDQVLMAGGTLLWKGAEIGDSISFKVFAPASSVAVNGGGTGNCTVDGFGRIIPSAGVGDHDVDLSHGVPVPIPLFDRETDSHTGMWQFTLDVAGKGDVAAADPPNTGNCNLLNAEAGLLVFGNRIPLLGSGAMNIQAQSIKPKTLWPGWKIRATMTNGGHTGLRIAWMFQLGRFSSL